MKSNQNTVNFSRQTTCTANYATHNAPGRFDALKLSVASIINQVDELRVFCNDIESFNNCAELVELYGDKFVRHFENRDLTDLGKFAFLPINRERSQFYFTCDDDIIYPDGYVDYTRGEMNRLHLPVVTYAGRILDPKDRFRYYKGGHKCFNFKVAKSENTVIDVPGTGVMCLNTSKFFPMHALMGPKKMADLVIAYELKKAGLKPVCLRHSQNFFKFVSLSGIWDEFQESEIEQIKLMQKIIDHV